MPLVVRWPGRAAAGVSSDQLVCLTDLFATCAKIVSAELPAGGAEDSISFLPALLGQQDGDRRTTLISHSNFGEFAYRDGPWKLVFKMSGANLEASRGKPTIAELYRLESDVAEQHDVSSSNPEIVSRMTGDFQQLIERGASRGALKGANDTLVRFDTIQTQRWSPGGK